jgi:hypothetical protein
VTGCRAGLFFDVNKGQAGQDSHSYAGNLQIWNDKLFFCADDGVHGYELWVTDGTMTGSLFNRLF